MCTWFGLAVQLIRIAWFLVLTGVHYLNNSVFNFRRVSGLEALEGLKSIAAEFASDVVGSCSGVMSGSGIWTISWSRGNLIYGLRFRCPPWQLKRVHWFQGGGDDFEVKVNVSQ